MALKIRKLSHALGAEVTGVDLRKLDDATFDEIRRAWHEHLLLRFPAQEQIGRAHV